MAAAIEVIGVISGLLGIVSFAQDNFGEADTTTSSVKITVGLDVSGGLDNAGGSLPDVRLFNEAGDFIGISNSADAITDGSTGEVKITHEDSSNGQQATYALLSANNDAICIAYMTMTWANGDQYGWVGDWGSECGATWYYSNVYVQGTSYKPNCMWIDANGDQPQTGFQVHWPEFVLEDGDAVDPEGTKRDYLCNSGAPFTTYTTPDPDTITFWTINNKRDETAKSTAKSRRQSSWIPRGRGSHGVVARNESSSDPSSSDRFANHLVLDDDPEHTTATLCESRSSVGPDFVNQAEGQFCRMSDKTVWPICSTDIQDDCFNTDSQQLIQGGLATRDSPYTVVTDWTASS
ncbi:hypothetical protein G7Z17_g1655 [Cylindrodendrum hubeiense]|uniref:Uncharacterized protein n=1 Tax=Cylindrodendrum hubeiense TaxID=595255 RepID=A0A9P5HKE5_9HYPO|nr:hypothetical protein G7Z17_g1655 [Cylindrodendrum hubeiense]